MTRLVKWLTIMVLGSTVAHAQGPYPAVAAYLGTGSPVVWSPWTSAAAFGALAYTPPQSVALYCQATSTSPWTPCAPGGGGGGSGTVTNIATTGPITGGPITTTGTIGCATCGVTGSPLSQFAATTSAQLAGVISDETGTGLLVFGTSPTLITPALGTPSALVLTNATGLPNAGLLNSSTTVNGQTCTLGSTCTVTAVATSAPFSALTGSTNTTAAMVVGTGASLSVSGSGTITATAVPLSGVTGLGTGVGTFLGTPSSANLAAALTDETGTGAAVFSTSPTLVTPVLGVASATTVTTTGATAGFYDFGQGSSSSAVAPCSAATSICVQAPTSVTAYLLVLPGAQPTTGNLSWNCTAANPSVCSWQGETVLRGTLTLTTATTDSATITGVTSSSNCTFSPTNSTAAAATTVAFVSSVSTNTVVIGHVATTASGGTLDIHCTVN